MGQQQGIQGMDEVARIATVGVDSLISALQEIACAIHPTTSVMHQPVHPTGWVWVAPGMCTLGLAGIWHRVSSLVSASCCRALVASEECHNLSYDWLVNHAGHGVKCIPLVLETHTG
uniref:Uncharacterized protein n=1 Tax=Oryza rufipogon TaxID=4529 RepID=A0A0E0PYB9_ORYRU